MYQELFRKVEVGRSIQFIQGWCIDQSDCGAMHIGKEYFLKEEAPLQFYPPFIPILSLKIPLYTRGK